MTKEQFRHDLRRGLGSCALELDRCGDPEAWREDLLWGLRHALAYDAQCEGTRALYFFELLERFKDPSPFFDLLAADARKNLGDRGWRFAHDAELLALMAGAGHWTARETLAELYDRLLEAIRAGRPAGIRIWGCLDNFGTLCIAVLSTVLQTRTEREAFYLRVLADYGRLLRQKPGIEERCDDESFDFEAGRLLGKERLRELQTDTGDDADLAAWLRNHELLREKYADCQARRPEREAETAQSLYDKLCAGQSVPLHCLFAMERRHGAEELTRFARLYAAEERAEVRAAMLRLLRVEGGAFSFDSGVSRLLCDAESEAAELREAALEALGGVRDTRVRDYALSRMERSRKDLPALYMLLNNFRPGDGARLIRAVKAVSLNEHNGDWHGVFRNVRTLIERDAEADRELSAALLPYFYREGYCSCCRKDSLELMRPRGLLTPALIEECRRDCNPEIRAFVGAQG